MDQPICGHGLLLSRSVGLVTAHHAAYTALKPQLADCKIEGLLQYLTRYDELVAGDWTNMSCCKMVSRLRCMPRSIVCARALDFAFTSPLIVRSGIAALRYSACPAASSFRPADSRTIRSIKIVGNPAKGTTPFSFGAGSSSMLVRLGMPSFSRRGWRVTLDRGRMCPVLRNRLSTTILIPKKPCFTE